LQRGKSEGRSEGGEGAVGGERERRGQGRFAWSCPLTGGGGGGDGGGGARRKKARFKGGEKKKEGRVTRARPHNPQQATPPHS
jgi:hypothetical protein